MSDEREVEVLQAEVAFKAGFFTIEKATLRREGFNGAMSDPITRYNLERGNGVAALVHDTEADTLFFVEQFRYGSYKRGQGWLLEIPAGILEQDETPEVTIRRELGEEIGYRAGALEKIGTVFVSPGGSSEQIFIFYAPVIAANQIGEGGGLAHEGEDVRVVRLSVTESLGRLTAGEIQDAKTVIALQWLQLQRGLAK